MVKFETMEEFYQHKFNGAPPRWLPDNLQQDLGHFNVFRIEDHIGAGTVPVRYNRRDFYKISLVWGQNLYHYADKSIELNGPTLLFFNPQVPYTWEPISGDITGFFCIFKEAFVTDKVRENLSNLPMFQVGGKPAYVLDKQQAAQVSRLFEKMLAEIESTYSLKYDLIRNYVMELIHSALKLHPSETLYQRIDAKARLTTVFTELLERQFPIESSGQRFRLRSATDFAQSLSVHVNHLNRSLRETTGKTTTEHITERLIGEAKALLRHTDWTIAEISYALGFEEPAHFTNFVKKQVGVTPSTLRNG